MVMLRISKYQDVDVEYEEQDDDELDYEDDEY